MRALLPIIVVILVVAGGWYFLSQAPAATQTTQTTTTETQTASTTTPLPTNVTVSFNASGFIPKTVTVPVGAKVTFVNLTQSRMWVASDVHPSHEEFDGTSKNTHCSGEYTGPLPFDQCAPGNSYSFTFTKIGTWDYHNHSASQFTGTVTVVAK